MKKPEKQIIEAAQKNITEMDRKATEASLAALRKAFYAGLDVKQKSNKEGEIVKSKNPETSPFYEVRQAANALGCSEKHVFTLLREGKIRGIRIGVRGIRIDRQSVDNFISENLIDPIEYCA